MAQQIQQSADIREDAESESLSLDEIIDRYSQPKCTPTEPDTKPA